LNLKRKAKNLFQEKFRVGFPVFNHFDAKEIEMIIIVMMKMDVEKNWRDNTQKKSGGEILEHGDER
jgi:hypothetical protein